MPFPQPISAGDKVYTGSLPNLTAATVMYFPVVNYGRLKRIAITPTVVTATGSGTAQFAYAPPGSSTFVDITNALLTLASGAAAGVVQFLNLPPGITRDVQEGGCIRVTVGGTATGGGTPQVVFTVGG